VGQDPYGFKYSKTIKFAAYIVMEVKAAAVENTGRILETETNLAVQCWECCWRVF